MNLRDIEYIVAVADTKSFQKAANQCYVSQPTLSGQIKKLENYLGGMIFERTTKTLNITPFGDEIISKARVILEQTNAIKNLSHDFKDPWHTPLKIGIIPSLGPYLIPSFLKTLRAEIGDYKFSFDEDITDNITQKLINRELDAIFLATDIDTKQFNEIMLFDEPFWVAYSSRDDMGHLNEIQTSDLNLDRMILLSDGHCLRNQIIEICNTYKQEDSVGFDTKASSLETLINLVSSGEGYTLVPALSLQAAWTTDKGIQVQKLKHEKAYRSIRLVYRKNYHREEQLLKLAELACLRLPNTVVKI